MNLIVSIRHLSAYCTAQSDQCLGANPGFLERGFICIKVKGVRIADFITFSLKIP